MLTLPSTTLAFIEGFIVASVLAAIGLGTYSIVVHRRQSPPMLETVYLEENATRFACAQHWARGALLSQPTEAWKPLCTAFAVSALACDNDPALATVLEEAQRVTSDRELLNIARQAAAEFEASRVRLDACFLTGKTLNGTPAWPLEDLRQRSLSLLQLAIAEGERLVSNRHSPAGM